MKRKLKRWMSDWKTILRCRLRDRRGQSMVEYALVSVLMLGGLATAGIIFLPNAIRAYNIYYRSFYCILNLPIP